ncbi:MAG: hypothetical protein C5B49_12835 [Bdellovibrio sp.]|nr:MAG: hypothetical protein C5B49_12835 [Bdellovibrio sp.]
MRTFFAAPSGAVGAPTIIVFQEFFGVNRHIRNVTSRLAEAGFVGVAPELFHRSAPALA